MHTFGCQKLQNKIGILIAQLGTPEAPTKEALRPYLKEFLSDPRVIEKPRLLWWLILNGIILNVRPKKSAALYKRIWTEEGSPLLVYTKNLSQKLARELQQEDSEILVDFGMRYGKPSIETALNNLISQGCKRIVLFNMYPQYSGSTTASNCDAFFKALGKQRWIPTVKIIDPYYNHPEFIKAYADTIKNIYNSFSKRPEKLVFSYHGVPVEYVKKGDPYCCMCNVTTKALMQELKFSEDEIIHTFQSRFGKDPWLTPYTDKTIISLAEKGIKKIAVVCPGFTTDCLETLDEIGHEAKEDFIKAGGEELHLIPCLNDSDIWVNAMKNIILEDISAWITQDRNKICSGFSCPAGVAWTADA